MSRGETKVDTDEYIDLIATGIDEHAAHIFLLVLNQLAINHHLSDVQREETKQEALTIALRDTREPVNVLRGMFSGVASGHG